MISDFNDDLSIVPIISRFPLDNLLFNCNIKRLSNRQFDLLFPRSMIDFILPNKLQRPIRVAFECPNRPFGECDSQFVLL